MATCPSCHSNIGTGALDTASRVQGAQGVDENGLPVPRWTEDSTLTKPSINGIGFSGITLVRATHIKELQVRANALETDAGITPTVFSNVDTDNHVSRRHVVELRQAVERLLNANGSTLLDFFRLDDNGNVVVQNPILIKIGATNPQSDWVGINRGEQYIDRTGISVSTFTLPDLSVVNSPTLPKDTKIRAIHVEDLRHPIPSGITPALMVDFTFTIYKGNKTGGANFKDVTTC